MSIKLVSYCHLIFIWKGAVPGTNKALVPESRLIINIAMKFRRSVMSLNICLTCGSCNESCTFRKHKLNRGRMSVCKLCFFLNVTLNKSNLNKSYSRLNRLCWVAWALIHLFPPEDKSSLTSPRSAPKAKSCSRKSLWKQLIIQCFHDVS